MDSERAPGIRFIYNYCNDMEAMRHFYIELLGLPLGFYMNDERGQVFEYNCGGIEFMWFPADPPLPVATQFSRQPGWPGGTLQGPSISIDYSHAQFADAVSRLSAAGVASFTQHPCCRGSYWEFVVLDPMGNTVELILQLGDEQLPSDSVWTTE